MDITYTYQEEKFVDLIPELTLLFVDHWEELANNKDVRPLDVDWDKYTELSDSNVLRIFTVRADAELIGYAFMIVSNSLHYKTWKMAVSDIYYIAPTHRIKGCGTRLFVEIKNVMKKEGVNMITVQDKIQHEHSKFFENLNFTRVENLYERVL